MKSNTFRTYLGILRHLRKCSLHEPNLKWDEARHQIRPQLPTIVAEYWAQHDHQVRIDAHDIKLELKRIRRPLENLLEVLGKTTLEARQAINVGFAREKKRSESKIEDIFLAALNANEALEVSSSSIVLRNYAAADRVMVGSTCARLIKLWEIVSGRPFVRTYETLEKRQLSRGTRPRKAFKQPPAAFACADAEFVRIAFESIDPKVTLSQVRTGLRHAVREKKETE